MKNSPVSKPIATNSTAALPPVSVAMITATLTAFLALYLSTDSVPVLVLPVFLLASVVLPYRFERDSGGIWGVRLMLYVGLAALGRSPVHAPGNFVDAQAFATAGMIAGGELCLQAFRRPPAGARFDPWIVSLSGVVFLIACNTNRVHLWVLAPLYMLLMLLSLPDLRPGAAHATRFGGGRRLMSIAVAVAMGGALHTTLWVNRGSIMAAGARLIASAPLTEQGTKQGDNPQLSNTFGGNTSVARLLRIEGDLPDGHLRSASFSTYGNGQWGPPLSRRAPLDSALPDQTGEEDAQKATIPRRVNNAKITLLRESGGVLYGPLNAHAIMPEIGQSFNWDRFQGPFVTEEPAPLTYYFTSSRKSVSNWPVEQGPLCVMPDERQHDELLEIPPDIDPKVGELAQQITATGQTQATKAAQIISYLLKNNAYSLSFARGSQDPISDFVLNKRAAHCQYFASASVMMLRAVGIPARYASGFYAQERDRDGALIVRGRDAHAWTEAYLGDGINLNDNRSPGNPNGRNNERSNERDSSGRRLYSAAEIAAAALGPDGVPDIGWVSLDATPPQGRADPAVNPTPFYQDTLEGSEDWLARVRAWFGRLTQLQIGGIMLVIVALWGLERARQKLFGKRHRSTVQAPPPALAPLARRFEKLLHKRGVPLSENQPWSESVPETLPEARDWVSGYNRARFSRAETDEQAEELRALERELEELER